MWQKTKHGLYRQFNFKDFNSALDFINQLGIIANKFNHYPRFENEWNVVQVWLITHEEKNNISQIDEDIAKAIDLIVENKKQDLNIKADITTKDHNINKEVKLFADGGSRGNPGPSASGFVILKNDSEEVIVDKGVYLGITTNNQAEYTALKLGLEECYKLQCQTVHVFMDSLLVINQMKGIYKIKNRDLWPIHNAILGLVNKFNHVYFQHVPREFNKLADAAVNRALDENINH